MYFYSVAPKLYFKGVTMGFNPPIHAYVFNIYTNIRFILLIVKLDYNIMYTYLSCPPTF